MFSSTICRLFLWHLFIAVVNCDQLLINTATGPVQGVVQRTLLNNVPYRAFKGIPFAEPPVGPLRYRSPRPIKPWTKPLLANEYGDACLVIDQSQLFPLNTTQSEDCLTLNVYAPVIDSKKIIAQPKKAVMFFIHGGAFTEGDSTDGFYGPDFLVEKDVVLVTFNYRLGPWGFTNFDLPGYTGNMGLKDQQLALQWTKQNIINFGGNPNLITVFGESVGGVSVHLQVINSKSRKFMKRAIAMSGVTYDHFSHYPANNHVELIKQVFQLDANATGADVLKFMQTAPTDLILQNAPFLGLPQGVVEVYWAPVIEDKRKAENPFLTRDPQEIIETDFIDTEVMFGVNSAEMLLFIAPPDYYSWIQPAENLLNIGLPFNGLTLQPNASLYQREIKKIYDFYFGTAPLQQTPPFMNEYVQLNSDTNLFYGIYTAARIHSETAQTYFYLNDLDLNLNFVKIQNGLQQFYGMSHFEDILYLFHSKKYAQLYDQILANQTDPTNKKTLNAILNLTQMFTNYAKTGSPGNFKEFSTVSPNYIHVTNDGLIAARAPKPATMNFWDRIYSDVKPWIVNAF